MAATTRQTTRTWLERRRISSRQWEREFCQSERRVTQEEAAAEPAPTKRNDDVDATAAGAEAAPWRRPAGGGRIKGVMQTAVSGN